MKKLQQKTIHLPLDTCAKIEILCKKARRSFNFVAVDLIHRALKKVAPKVNK